MNKMISLKCNWSPLWDATVEITSIGICSTIMTTKRTEIRMAILNSQGNEYWVNMKYLIWKLSAQIQMSPPIQLAFTADKKIVWTIHMSFSANWYYHKKVWIKHSITNTQIPNKIELEKKIMYGFSNKDVQIYKLKKV